MSHLISDLLPLLKDERMDLRKPAYQIIAYQSGRDRGLKEIEESSDLLELLADHLRLAANERNEKCLQCLTYILTVFINVCATETGPNTCLTINRTSIIPMLVKIISDKNSKNADGAASVLVNVTRSAACCKKVLAELAKDEQALYNLIMIAGDIKYNSVGNSLSLVMNFLENISQLEEGRSILLDRTKCVISRILPFTRFPDAARRRAAIGCIYNCCFEKDSHSWLLSKDVDIASYLCYPLLNGSAEFTDLENDELSDLLAYPNSKKEIESEPELRLLLLKALMKLCLTREAREELRKQSIYCVLREYHKWEKSTLCLTVLEDLVNILIRTEKEIGHDDLSNPEIPEEILERFRGINTDDYLDDGKILDIMHNTEEKK